MKKSILTALLAIATVTFVSCNDKNSAGETAVQPAAQKYYHEGPHGQFEISETLYNFQPYQENKHKFKTATEEKHLLNNLKFHGLTLPDYKGNPVPETLQ